MDNGAARTKVPILFPLLLFLCRSETASLELLNEQW
jgi:hypothetical protein